MEAARAAADHCIAARARKVVEIWNARSELFFYPTIRAAITAGCPWLDYMCPACCRIGEIDLRQVDRHPDASISSLIQELSCRSCRPNPPFAKLVAPETGLLLCNELRLVRAVRRAFWWARAASVDGRTVCPLSMGPTLNSFLFRLMQLSESATSVQFPFALSG